MICSKTQRESSSNMTNREMTDVEKIEEFLSEQRLRWFRHMERMDDEKIL